jgi:hypothetical protein
VSNFYYFFIAALPHITLDEPPPFSKKHFLEECTRWLPHDDAADITALLSGQEDATTHAACREWREWEHSLRSTLVSARAALLHCDPAQYLRGPAAAESDVRTGVQEVMKMSSPVDREKALDQLKWNFLDRMAGAHVFDFHVVVAYALKLRIVLRWAELSEARGIKIVENALANPRAHHRSTDTDE